jgi:drug/metabolite transporter (DMT)-like permease
VRRLRGPSPALSSAPHDRRNEIVGIGLAVAAAISFGTLAIVAKFAYEDGADALPLLAVRFGLTTLILVIVHALTRRSLGLPRATALKLLAIGAFGYGFEALLFFRALEYADASVVSLIFYSFPLITTFFALVTGMERFSARTTIALALGTLGVITIFSIETGDPTGPLLALAAAFAVAVYFLLAEVFTRGVEPSVSATWTALGATIALSITLLFTSWDFPKEAFVPALGLGLATAFSFVTIYAAIARLGSARVSVASMMEPVATVAFAAIFLDEEITTRIVLGACLIISALPVLAYKGRPRSDAPVAPDTL